MNPTIYLISLTLVTLAALVNRGNGNKAHQAIQLYLMVLILFCALVVFGQL